MAAAAMADAGAFLLRRMVWIQARGNQPGSRRTIGLMKTPHLLLVRCSLLLALPLSALAASSDAVRPENRPITTETRPALKQVDRHFLDDAVKSSMEEAEISRVAVERTSNPKVREFAQTILSDHQNTNEALTMIAANRGVSVPAKSNDANAWSKKDAKNFDKEYVDKMVSMHEDAVKLFQKQATDGDDAETVAFARKTLPKLQHHLEQANDLKRLMK
jgi:putative membrane protein